MNRWLAFLLLATLLATLTGCAPAEKTPLSVFAAGSLIQPFDELEKAFEAAYPQIDILNEYHGSIQVIRHVTDIHEKIDVVATADHSLMPMLMYQTTNPDTGKRYADWSIRFATNRLGIAYTDRSLYADEITAENWWEILARPDVKVGIADPRFDASGYRTLMVFKLAEQPAQQPALFHEMFIGQFRLPLSVAKEDGRAIIYVPEILETKESSHIVIRGSSIQLIALLESGDLDYAFEYESVIQQHSLRLLALPNTLNLGDEAQAETYAQVAVKLDFQRFATVKPEFAGEPIAYGITIPTNAPHPEEAELFIAFLLGPEGRKIMAENHHPLFDPATADAYDALPASLQALTQPTP